MGIDNSKKHRFCLKKTSQSFTPGVLKWSDLKDFKLGVGLRFCHILSPLPRPCFAQIEPLYRAKTLDALRARGKALYNIYT